MSSMQRNKYNPDGRVYFRAWALAFLIMAILLFGCSMASDEREDPRTTKEGTIMVQAPKSTVPTSPMPPIDAETYARVETATFALG